MFDLPEEGHLRVCVIASNGIVLPVSSVVISMCQPLGKWQLISELVTAACPEP